jgi:hypothetical protein
MELVSVPTAATTTAAAAVSATATTAAAVSAAATTAAAAIFLRASLVDVQSAAIEFATVQFVNRTLGFGIHRHLDEPKSAGLARVAVRYQADAVDGAIGLKQGAHRIFGRPVAQISNKNVFHDLPY